MSQFQNAVEALQHWAQQKPDSIAIIFRGKDQQRSVMTWASIYTLSGRFAAVLRGKGVARGGLVINTLPNSPERVVCEAGIWMSGAASVNGQCLLADGSDLLHTISKSRASTILVDPDVSNSPWNVLKNHVTLGQDDTLTSSSLPDLKKILFVRRVENEGEGDFIGHLKSSDNWFQADDIDPDDNISVFSTSGSTGFSKLVVYTHRRLIGFLSCELTFCDTVRNSPKHFSLAPQGWLGGCMMFFFIGGTTNITCDFRSGSPEDTTEFFWNTIQEEHCSSAFTPSIYLPNLVELTKSHQQKCDSDVSISPVWKVPIIMLGGQPITKSIVEAALKVGDSVCISYGSTDVGLISSFIVTDSQNYADLDTGKHNTGIEDIKIVHPDNEDAVLPTNQLGYILLKGPFVMKSYLNDPKENTNAFTKDGFFRTGDVGRLDERGHLFVEGRGSDAIMRGVYIFYPTWIEERLRACPGVQDAIVVGVPDPFLHQELCACLVLESTEVCIEQVQEFMKKDVVVSDNNLLSPRPRYYLKFESFPKTSTFKPKRKDITTTAAQRLGLS